MDTNVDKNYDSDSWSVVSGNASDNNMSDDEGFAKVRSETKKKNKAASTPKPKDRLPPSGVRPPAKQPTVEYQIETSPESISWRTRAAKQRSNNRSSSIKGRPMFTDPTEARLFHYSRNLQEYHEMTAGEQALQPGTGHAMPVGQTYQQWYQRLLGDLGSEESRFRERLQDARNKMDREKKRETLPAQDARAMYPFGHAPVFLSAYGPSANSASQNSKNFADTMPPAAAHVWRTLDGSKMHTGENVLPNTDLPGPYSYPTGGHQGLSASHAWPHGISSDKNWSPESGNPTTDPRGTKTSQDMGPSKTSVSPPGQGVSTITNGLDQMRLAQQNTAPSMASPPRAYPYGHPYYGTPYVDRTHNSDGTQTFTFIPFTSSASGPTRNPLYTQVAPDNATASPTFNYPNQECTVRPATNMPPLLSSNMGAAPPPRKKLQLVPESGVYQKASSTDLALPKGPKCPCSSCERADKGI